MIIHFFGTLALADPVSQGGKTDWLMLVAVLLSPVIAVLVTLWWQQRKEKRDGKIRLFTTLMAYRKSFPISYEWANSLNVIDVVFADSPKVLDHWHKYYDMLHQPTPANLQARQHEYLDLMSAMAKSLGFNRLQQTDIDKFYTPPDHTERAEQEREYQKEVLRVLKNTAKVEVQQQPLPPPTQ